MLSAVATRSLGALAKLTDIQRAILKIVGFEPHPEQAEILACGKRFILVAGGDQAGKSITASAFALTRLGEYTRAEGDVRPGLYWIVAVDYMKTRAEFRYLVDFFVRLGVLQEATKRVDPGYIELADGTRFETKSAKDPRSLAMDSPDGIIACEASQLDLESYLRLESRAAPRNAWMFMSGTFESSLGWYPVLAKQWAYGTAEHQSFRLPSTSNTHLYPLREKDPKLVRLKNISSDTFYMERIMGIPCPPKGLVFPEFQPVRHVREIEFDPEFPVSIWVDVGYNHAYAVEAAQIINDQVKVFDEVYEQGLGTEDIIDICKRKRWWGNVSNGAIDLGGTQHQGTHSPWEIWLREAGINLKHERVGINEGTERLKAFLKLNPITGEPQIIFSPKCRGLLSEFGTQGNPFDGQMSVYRWRVDSTGNVVGNTPDDKHNDGVKAVIYGLVSCFGFARTMVSSHVRMRRWE